MVLSERPDIGGSGRSEVQVIWVVLVQRVLVFAFNERVECGERTWDCALLQVKGELVVQFGVRRSTSHTPP